MKAIVVANWKMNPETFAEAKALFAATKKALDKAPQISLIMAPPSIFLRELARSYKGKRVVFAAQNAHFEEKGSHTGEISMTQVKDAGAKAVIIGHAERRAAGESDDDVRKKVAAAINQGLTAILCVGDKERSGEGAHFETVKTQLAKGLAEAKKEKLSKLLIAYEPVWAIGSSAAMSPHDMHEMAIFIRKTLNDIYGARGMGVKILYGGSIDEENAAVMLEEGDVDGLLVGRASIDAEAFPNFLKAIQSARA